MSDLSLHLIALEDGRYARTSRLDLQTLIGTWQQSPQADHLVIQFHGGLVSGEDARQVAYPLVLIWNIEDELQKDLVIKQETARIASGVRDVDEVEARETNRGLTVKGSTAALMSPSVLEEIAAGSPAPETLDSLTHILKKGF